MKINKNDPQLTAYVLNELSPQQMKAIETQIQTDPELKAEVARIKSNMNQLKALKTNEVFRLDPHQRENIFKAAGISQTSTWSKFFKYSGGLVAASLAVVVYINNSGSLKNAASSKVSGMQAAPALSEMSEAPSTKVVARAESRPMAAKKFMSADQESEDSALAAKSRGAPPPGEMAADAAPMADQAAPIANLAPAKVDLAEAKLTKDSAQNLETRKGSFTAGEVGAADMSQNKMRLLEPSQARKKEAAAEEALAPATAPAGLAAKSFGSEGAGASLGSAGGVSGASLENVKPIISKQLYDLESKSSQPEIYAKIADPIFKCFESSLSQYVKYDVAWNLTWSARLGNVTRFNSEIIDNGTESLKNPRQDFTNEIACVEQAIRTAFKKSLPPSQNETVFKYRFILKSK